MAVERRDPVARQRQFFARRREERGLRNVNRPRRTKSNASASLELYRCAPRVVPQLPHELPNLQPLRVQAAPKMNHISTDMLLLDNSPAALQAVVGELPERKRRRHDRPPRPPSLQRDRAPEVTEFERLQQLQDNTAAASINEIRIFDVDQERTARYRPRVLPDSFLNSEKPRTADRLLSRKRAVESSESNVVHAVEHVSKRFRESAVLHSPSVQRRYLNDPRLTPRRAQTQMYHPGSTPNISASAGKEELEYECRQSSQPREDDSTPLGRLLRAETSRINDSFPHASDDDDVRSPKRKRPITALLREAGLVQEFPAIEIDSDSDDLARMGTISGIHKPRSYESILAREPLQLDMLSAEILRIEYKLLDDPDQDVRAFSKRRRKRGMANKITTRCSTGHKLQPSFLASKFYQLDLPESMEGGPSTPSIRAPKALSNLRSEHFGAKKKPDPVLELAISAPEPNRNPVTVATKVAGSETNTAATSYPT